MRNVRSGRSTIADRIFLLSRPRRRLPEILVVVLVFFTIVGCSLYQYGALGSTLGLFLGSVGVGTGLLVLKRQCADVQTPSSRRKALCLRIRQLSQRQRAWRICIVALLVLAVFVYVLVFDILAKEFGYRPSKVPPQLTKEENNELLTVFLIDGLRADIFEEELEAGNLPQMKDLANTGCRVKSVMATFPSITGYAYWPLLTGIDATRSGHLGTRYFDRRGSAGNWKNHYGLGSANFEPGFETQVSTLFEAAPGWTFAGNSMLRRGANYTYTSSLEQYFTKISHVWWLPKLLRKIPILKWLAPDFVEYETRYLRRTLKILQHGKPRVVWIVFASPDNVAHAVGVHDVYRDVLRAIDHSIGTYVKTVRSDHDLASLTFAVVSDHVSMHLISARK